MKLEGKVALVTGAGSGLGRAMLGAFYDEGAKVVAADIDAASAQDAVSGFEQERALSVEADVARAESVRAMIEETVSRFGRLDILCNNAGVLDDYKPLLETPEELWDTILGINLKGAYLGAYYAVPKMLGAGGGVIINTASIAGLVAGGGGTAYTAAKHGMLGLTKQLALDYGKKGIRVNAICPGAIETGLTEELLKDEAQVQMLEELPAGRVGKVDDIAKLALYLASDDSSFVHGAAMVIDGGWTIQ